MPIHLILNLAYFVKKNAFVVNLFIFFKISYQSQAVSVSVLELRYHIHTHKLNYNIVLSVRV